MFVLSFFTCINVCMKRRGATRAKSAEVSAENLQKLRKPAEAYGNPTEDSVAKPCGNLWKSYGSLWKPYGNLLKI